MSARDLLAGALLVLMAGCSGVPKVTPSGPSGSSTLEMSLEPSSSAPVEAGQEVLVTERDSGKSFTFTSATDATLSLTDDVLWEEPAVEGSSVTLVKVSSESPTGSKVWQIRINGKGTSAIRTSGGTNCPKGMACTTVMHTFQVTIIVE